MASGRATGKFVPADRLLDSRDFQRVLRRGHRRSCKELVVVTHSRPSDPPPRGFPEGVRGETRAVCRLGITTSRKVGNAVARNRFKRRARAWFRHRRDELEPGTDVVVIARPAGPSLDFEALDDRLSELLDLAPISATNPERV